MIDTEKCHYCGKEFRVDSNDLTIHLRETTEVLAELPALLGSSMQMGSIDLHNGKLYSIRVRPTECMDDVQAREIKKEEAAMMIEAELSFHQEIVRRLAVNKENVLAKLERL